MTATGRWCPLPTESLGPRGTISESAETFFAVDLEDFQDGYIRGRGAR